MKSIFPYFLLSKVEKKAFINIFFIALFAMSSLLIANVLYSDDPTRVTTGETFWNDNGRPLATLISLVLQLGKPLTDISPLPQVLAFAIYALSAVYLGKLFKVDDLLLLTLCGVVFVLSPFNLQNFAFVFDSYTMAVAVFTSTLAALGISISISDRLKRKEQIISFSFSFLLLLCSVCLYQAATSVYLVTCFFYALVKLLNGQKQQSFHNFIASLIILLFSFVAYIPLKNFFIGNDEYNLYHSQLISVSDFPQKTINNLQASWRNIQQALGNGTLNSLFYILLIVTILTIVASAISLQKKSTINSDSKSLFQYLFDVIFIAFYILVLVMAVSGVMLILENPIFLPRTMMGFSALVAICCLFLSHKFSQKNQRLFKYGLISFLIILSIAFANVSFTFGNVLYTQNVQEEIIATILVSDLGEIIPKLPIPQQHLAVAVVNTLDYTYGNTKAYEKYPILKSITWYYLQHQIQFYTKLETLGFKFNAADYRSITVTGANNEFIPQTEAILIRPLYKIYFENDKILVIVLQNPNY